MLPPGLAWKACLKKTKIELGLLRYFDMLKMVETEIRGEICHAIHRYTTINNIHMI